MSAGTLAVKLVSAVLLPPLNLVLVGLAGYMLWQRGARRWGGSLVLLAVSFLLIFSTVAGAMLLVGPLERYVAPLVAVPDPRPQAIVVLGGGKIADAPEYGGRDQPTLIALARLRYAARLHRETGLPLLASGGSPEGSPGSEAAAMARVLHEDFGASEVWLEERSRNTAENAAFSAAILRQHGIQRILLVTDATHMPRAHAIFQAAGLDAVAAPTLFYTRDRLLPSHFIPGGEGARLTHYALHEWIGIAWYRLRYKQSARVSG